MLRGRKFLVRIEMNPQTLFAQLLLHSYMLLTIR